MKTWVNKNLIKGASIAITLAGLTACGMPGGYQHGNMSAEKMARIQSTVIERVNADLSLSSEQKVRLDKVFEVFNKQHQAIHESNASPEKELRSLIGGNTFDRERAINLHAQKTETMKNEGPKLISALADFYDNLNPQQQAKLRERLEKGPQW
jgi:Spy/CpxP family protein refolding chaperone